MTQAKKTNSIEIIKRARRVSTPIVAVETSDVAGFATTLSREMNGHGFPVVGWDGVRGVFPMNDDGIEAISKAAAKMGADAEALALQSANPVEALRIVVELPAATLVLHQNSHLFFSDPFFVQGIANVRDEFKADGRTLVLLAPSFSLPPEIRSDVVVLEDPFPSDVELRELVSEIAEAAGFEIDDDATIGEAVNATRGLSRFGAEQVLALSATPDGLDLDELWRRKIAAVNQTKGLTLTIERDATSSDVGGLAAILKFADGLFGGERSPKAIVWIDEIEKAFGGLGSAGGPGDSSGVTQDSLGTMLRWMDGGGDRRRSVGLLLVGPPGTGKSLLAKTLAKRTALPLFAADLGAAKGSLVGESERAIREMFRVIDGVADGAALVVATCNKLDVLPPELRRRFSLGTWFCDLPNEDERAEIWGIHKRLAGIPANEKPTFDDDGWTGAEIRNACDLAARLDVSIDEASSYVVPVSQADPKSIDALRTAASGRWLSATNGGAYKATARSVSSPKRARAFSKE